MNKNITKTIAENKIDNDFVIKHFNQPIYQEAYVKELIRLMIDDEIELALKEEMLPSELFDIGLLRVINGNGEGI